MLIIHCYYENWHHIHVTPQSWSMVVQHIRLFSLFTLIVFVIDLVEKFFHSPLERLWEPCFQSLAFSWEIILRFWSSLSIYIIPARPEALNTGKLTLLVRALLESDIEGAIEIGGKCTVSVIRLWTLWILRIFKLLFMDCQISFEQISQPAARQQHTSSCSLRPCHPLLQDRPLPPEMMETPPSYSHSLQLLASV